MIACWPFTRLSTGPTPPLMAPKSLFKQNIFACRTEIQTVPYAPV